MQNAAIIKNNKLNRRLMSAIKAIQTADSNAKLLLLEMVRDTLIYGYNGGLTNYEHTPSAKVAMWKLATILADILEAAAPYKWDAARLPRHFKAQTGQRIAQNIVLLCSGTDRDKQLAYFQEMVKIYSRDKFSNPDCDAVPLEQIEQTEKRAEAIHAPIMDFISLAFALYGSGGG